MSFKFKHFVGVIGVGVGGGITGAAAGVSAATNLGITDLSMVGIVTSVGGGLGLLGGLSEGIGTLWSGDDTGRKREDQHERLLACQRIAHFAWVLIAIGIALPYLAVAMLTVLHLSQIGTMKLDGAILSRAAGLVGVVLWIDGFVLQLLTASPNIRVLMKLALTLL